MGNSPQKYGGGSPEFDTGPQVGAMVKPRYYDSEPDMVLVAVDDLNEFRAGSREEFWQFVIGEFCVAGGIWLGLERGFTVEKLAGDLLFWICIISLIAGLGFIFFGYRQLKRRKTRIEKIISKAEEAEKRRMAAREAEMS